jgi:hypothetical protein
MLGLCGFAASRCAGPAFGCPVAFGLVAALTANLSLATDYEQVPKAE